MQLISAGFFMTRLLPRPEGLGALLPERLRTEKRTWGRMGRFGFRRGRLIVARVRGSPDHHPARLVLR